MSQLFLGQDSQTKRRLSDPSAGVARVFVRYYTQVFGTACLDLCLFNTDPSAGVLPYGYL